MDNPSASNIRTLIRAENNQRRSERRDYNLCVKRKTGKVTTCSSERVISQEEVIIIAGNIKQKRKANVNELALLKLSFLQDSDNIIIFLKQKGALQSLIRELSGSNSDFQLAAAECVCNMALGNPKSCIQLAKAGSPYLISHLQGLNYNLMNTSVWTLGNLAGSDIKTWEVVRSQGLLQRLLHLLIVPELVHNTLYAIVQFLKVGLHKLDAEEVKELTTSVIKELSNNASPNSCLALYLLSCSHSQLCQDILLENNVSELCLKIVENSVVTADTVKSVTCLVRTVANLIPEKMGVVVGNVLTNWKLMQLMVNKLLMSGYSHFKSELMWLVGNILSHESSAVQEILVNYDDEFTCLFK